MRHVKGVAAAVLLSAIMFNSCTCEKAVAPPPTTTLKEMPSGFHAAGSDVTPLQQAKAPTAPEATATPAEVAAAATPPAAVEVPKDFPVPVFEGATVAQVQGLANNAQNVIFKTSASTNELYNFYQDKLTHSGWKLTQQFQRGGHAFMSFKKGDMVANVQIVEDSKNPGQQTLAVMYEQEKPLDFDEF